MKSKSLIFSIFLVFIVVLGLSVVSAADSDDSVLADGEPMTGLPEDVSGTVSGGVDVVTTNPGGVSGQPNTGELTYDVPSDAKNIKDAVLYVNVYSANAKNESGLSANTTLITDNGEQQLGSEKLWIPEENTNNGNVYDVNDHVTKCYSDYQIRYDVTSLLQGLNGTSVALKVDTFKLANGTDGSGNTTYYKFDGRIKMIALVVAYDDGDDDVINYWVNAGQAWTKQNTTTVIDTGVLPNLIAATLESVVLSSADANYTINDEELEVLDHESGTFNYQYNCWDVTDVLDGSDDLTLFSKYVGTSAYGSLKNVLAVLTTSQYLVDEPMTGLPEDISGTVSGGVDFVSTNPGGVSGQPNYGELTYDIPADAKNIKDAVLYVNVYTANAKNESGLIADTSLSTVDFDDLLVGSEDLWTSRGSSDGKIYFVNDHAYKCYSDYQIRYDVTSLLQDLNGTSVTFKVGTSQLPSGFDEEGNVTYYKFDGRIKMIALVVAYDDGDDDVINYWVNAGQAWTKQNTTTVIDTGVLPNLIAATLESVVLSSADANYTINDKELAASNHTAGTFNYQYNCWDVTDVLKDAANLTLFSKYAGTSVYGSLKNVLAVLTTTQKVAEENDTNTTPVTPDQPTNPTGADTPKVTKASSKIVAKKATFKAKKKVKKYTITLKSGKKAIKKVKVTLKVKGKTYKATTNSKGKATFKITKLTKKGKYTAKIKFAGNANYKAANKNVKITIK